MSFAKSYELSQVMNFASIFENVLASFQSLFHKPIKVIPSPKKPKKKQKENLLTLGDTPQLINNKYN